MMFGSDVLAQRADNGKASAWRQDIYHCERVFVLYQHS